VKQNQLFVKRRELKIGLGIAAIVIVACSMFYTNYLVKQFAEQDQKQVNTWAQAVQRHAEAMRFSEEYFNSVENQERNRMELLAMAYRGSLSDNDDRYLNIYTKIILSNISIPIIITDQSGRIVFSANLPENQIKHEYFDDEMQRIYSKYDPIPIKLINNKMQYLYYTESLIYTELYTMLETLFNTFLTDIVTNAVSAPVIIINEDRTRILEYGNLDSTKMTNSDYVEHQLATMSKQHKPIEIDFPKQHKAYIYYRSSDLLLHIRYFPLFQLFIIIIFIIVAYIFFSNIRRSDQNMVWAGMAKETAHQIGTPLSSLMGWVELLKLQDEPFEGTAEMETDLERLQNITDRFSKIGSMPKLEPTDIVEIINSTVGYMQKRFSSKIEFEVVIPENTESIQVPLNAALFGWVLENLIKNAVDAMGDKGKITIELKEESGRVCIDVTDTGKGMHKSAFKQIFNPGYTSKKRGWGLGLSLAKRIVEEYHKGRIYVKSSNIGRGTTFRISLKKKMRKQRTKKS